MSTFASKRKARVIQTLDDDVDDLSPSKSNGTDEQKASSKYMPVYRDIPSAKQLKASFADTKRRASKLMRCRQNQLPPRASSSDRNQPNRRPYEKASMSPTRTAVPLARCQRRQPLEMTRTPTLARQWWFSRPWVGLGQQNKRNDQRQRHGSLLGAPKRPGSRNHQQTRSHSRPKRHWVSARWKTMPSEDPPHSKISRVLCP